MHKRTFAATALLVGTAALTIGLGGMATGCGGANGTADSNAANAGNASAASLAPVSIDAGAAKIAAPVPITLIGTNDVHGRLAALPLFASFVANVRAAVGAGNVVVVDAGDMFQGTLESNLAEGEPVIRAYNAIGYDAVTLGNHEFDYGPAGARSTPTAPNDDPRGALKARASEAKFPFLTANIADVATHQAVSWPNVHPTALIEKAGVKIGLIGAGTQDTPRTTIASNFSGLEMLPTAPVVTTRAAELRKAGADLVILVAHAGGKCGSFGEDSSSCEKDEEMMALLKALAPGTLDAVVAGHTHAPIANRIEGVAVIESFSNAKAFGRVDFMVDPTTHKVVSSEIRPPTELAKTSSYEGHAVAPDPALTAMLAPYIDRARARKEEKIGITLDTPITREHAHESALGNLFANLLELGVRHVDVAMVNGGGLRADLPAGDLSYGALFEAMPFDNRLAIVTIKGAELRKIVTDNLTHANGIASWAGLEVVATCKKGALEVQLKHPHGNVIRDADPIVLATSDFIALGGDGVPFAPATVALKDELIRDIFEAELKKLGGHLSAKQLFDPAHRRVVFPGERPARCASASPSPAGSP